MFFLIPAEISAVLTAFFCCSPPGCSLDSFFLGCSGCSCALTDSAGARKKATAAARMIRVNIEINSSFLCFACSSFSVYFCTSTPKRLSIALKFRVQRARIFQRISREAANDDCAGDSCDQSDAKQETLPNARQRIGAKGRLS